MEDTFVYVWANPLKSFGILDHTWVVTYNPIQVCPPDTSKGDYWYCWGICHETGKFNPKARLLHVSRADMKLANCISKPNDKEDHAGITSWYGRYGVCHQVANRILFSVATDIKLPLLVNGAHGFWLSHLLYGNYGGSKGNWENVQQKCGVVRIQPNLMDLSPMIDMLRLTLGDDFSDEMIKQLRDVQQEMLMQKAAMEEMVEANEMSVENFAIAINRMLTKYMPQLAQIVGIEYSRLVFGVDSGEEVYLIDVEMAAKSDRQ